MRTFDSDRSDVFDVTDRRSNSGALLLEAFPHGLLKEADTGPYCRETLT